MAKTKRTATAQPPVKYSKLVCAIVAEERDFKYSPAYPRSVVAAVNLTINYLMECRELYPDHWVDEITETDLEEHDREFIKRIARTIHLARIERGF